MIPSMTPTRHVEGPGLASSHAYGRLTRCRVVDNCVVQSATCTCWGRTPLAESSRRHRVSPLEDSPLP